MTVNISCIDSFKIAMFKIAMFKIAIVVLQNCCMLSHIQSKQHSYHFAPFEGSIVVTNGWIIILRVCFTFSLC